MRLFTRFALAVALVSGLASGARAAPLEYGAGDFSAWSSQTFLGFVGGQVVSPQASGGNPGASLLVTTVTNAATFTGHFDPAFVYDPANGAIASISASLDYLNVSSFGQGHGGSALLLRQGASWFYAGSFLTGSTVDGTWRTTSVSNATAVQFARLAGSDTLDFSSAGAPITLGFWTANESGNGITVRYDNWTASVTAVPAPPAVMLMATAVAGLAGWRVRRARA